MKDIPGWKLNQLLVSYLLKLKRKLNIAWEVESKIKMEDFYSKDKIKLMFKNATEKIKE